MRFFTSFLPLPCWGGRSGEQLGGLWQPAQVNIFIWIYLHIIPILVWGKVLLWDQLPENTKFYSNVRTDEGGSISREQLGDYERDVTEFILFIAVLCILSPFRSKKLSQIASVLRLHKDYHSRQGDFTTAPHDSAQNFPGLGSAVWFHGLHLAGATSAPKGCCQIFTPKHYFVNMERTRVATYS